MPPKSLPISAGPNQRAGLTAAPVSGPKIITSRPSVSPIASGAHSWRARGLNATAHTASTSRKVPMPLDDRAREVAGEERADRRGAVVAGAALVEQEPLDQQRAEDAAGELGEDVDRPRRPGRCAAGRAAASVTAGLKCPPLTAPSVMISPNSTNAVHEADDREVGAGLGVRRWWRRRARPRCRSRTPGAACRPARRCRRRVLDPALGEPPGSSWSSHSRLAAATGGGGSLSAFAVGLLLQALGVRDHLERLLARAPALHVHLLALELLVDREEVGDLALERLRDVLERLGVVPARDR